VDSGTRKLSWRLLGTVIAALVAVGLTPGTAAAAPSNEQIAQARAAADAVAARITDLSGRLAAAQGAVADAHAASALALDDYQATEEAYQAAHGRAVVAAAAAEKATADLGVARDDVVAFARRSYMQGSTYAGASALLTAGDPAQLIERAALLEAAGAHRSDVLGRVRVLQQQATHVEGQARAALAEADALKAQATHALTVAQTAERTAREQAAALDTEQAQLRGQLSAARAELTALIGERQAADRAARAAAAAPRPQPRLPVASAPVVSAPAPVDNDSQAGGGSASAASVAIDAAMRYLGTPYAWGGGGSGGPGRGLPPDAGVVGFDCSGLTQYAYAQAGVTIPRNSRAQYSALPKVSRGSLQAGDLVFWAWNPSNWQTIHHVAIYLGDGRVLQAPESGDVVKISTMWWNGYAGAVRPSA
jgi:cell wall-associated NlpC family hydrolase